MIASARSKTTSPRIKRAVARGRIARASRWRWNAVSPRCSGFTEFAAAETDDLPALCATFAAHELGTVPPAHVAVLQNLSSSHRLGVVSNICGDPAAWRAHFVAVGLASVFTSIVFSSEGRSIKPSSRIFHQSFAAFPDAQRILFVGDSWYRDMVPAKQLGCATAWISDTGRGGADCVIPSLLALPTVAT
jgi:FMN phosphatase YigB (HAD superfamily)